MARLPSPTRGADRPDGRPQEERDRSLTIRHAFTDCAACEDARPDRVLGSAGRWRTESVTSSCTRHTGVRFVAQEGPGEPETAVLVLHPTGTPVRSRSMLELLCHDLLFELSASAGRPLHADGARQSRLAFIADRVLAWRAMADRGAPLTEDRLAWALSGWRESTDIDAAVAAGLSEEGGAHWLTTLNMACPPRDPDFTGAEALAWWVALSAESEGLPDVEVAEGWVEIGVRTPTDRPPGLSADDVNSLLAAKVESRDPAWAGVGALCPRMVQSGLALRKRPEEIVALFTALKPEGPVRDDDACEHEPRLWWYCGWDVNDIRPTIALATEACEDDWHDLALCLHAGMEIDEAMEYLRTGGDMEPVKVMAALHMA